MLRWAILFAIIAIVAGGLGFGVLSDTSARLAQLFALVFVVLFVVSLLFGRRGSPPAI